MSVRLTIYVFLSFSSSSILCREKNLAGLTCFAIDGTQEDGMESGWVRERYTASVSFIERGEDEGSTALRGVKHSCLLCTIE